SALPATTAPSRRVRSAQRATPPSAQAAGRVRARSWHPCGPSTRCPRRSNHQPCHRDSLPPRRSVRTDDLPHRTLYTLDTARVAAPWTAVAAGDGLRRHPRLPLGTRCLEGVYPSDDVRGYGGHHLSGAPFAFDDAQGLVPDLGHPLLWFEPQGPAGLLDQRG